jgi:hypothetical protein
LLHEDDDEFDNQYMIRDFDEYYLLLIQSNKKEIILFSFELINKYTIVKAPSATRGFAPPISCSGSPSTLQSIVKKQLLIYRISFSTYQYK